jgi:hypothetical protein
MHRFNNALIATVALFAMTLLSSVDQVHARSAKKQDDSTSDDSSSSCETGAFPTNGIYDTTIVYSIDAIYDAAQITTVPPFFRPMSDEVNTLEFRSKAYTFLKEQYGLDFDPAIVGDQIIAVDESGAKAIVTPVFLAPESVDITHQVYAIDSQLYP